MYFLFVFIGALMAQGPIEPCAGTLLRTSRGAVVDARPRPMRLRTGDVLEVAYDDGRVENVVVRVSRRHVYFPYLVEGLAREGALDDAWVDRILHVRLVGHVYVRIDRAFYATSPLAF